MQKIRLFLFSFVWMIFLCTTVQASHVKGGWIGYQYLGAGTTQETSKYSITVYLYIDCHNVNAYTGSVILGIFDSDTKASINIDTLLTQKNQKLQKTTFSPCLINKPDICYNVYTYNKIVELKNNNSGYDINVQFRARVSNIVNIVLSSYTGITLFAKIPGKIDGKEEPLDAHVNNSPQFDFLDTTTVCHNSNISIPFSAVDPDKDSLSYRFGVGNDAGGDNNNVLVTPSPPPYAVLQYASNYSGAYPLGPNVTINPKTGLISGTAPNLIGEFVIAVYVDEWRNGRLISTSKKELQIDVTNCSLQSASLDPSYINCKDYTFTFKNSTTVSPNSIYTWNFGAPESPNNISSSPTPTFEYPDTGTYTLKLKVGVSEECLDSTTSEVKVYPGFVPQFINKGNCVLSTTNFWDSTTTKSGNVNSWYWDFGDNTSSSEQNPKHQYPKSGDYKAILTVGNTKGCSDSISHTITVVSDVGLSALFLDTTICNKDSIQLVVNSRQADRYVWNSLDQNMLDANTNTPIVFPKVNTEYSVTAYNGDCNEQLKINVNLLGDLQLIADDIYACIGDSAKFNVASQAAKYEWTSISGMDSLNDNNIKEPSFRVSNSNVFDLKASYGKNCRIEKNIQVLAAPYPTLKIQGMDDTTICKNNSILLATTGSTTDNVWLPTNEKKSSIIVKPSENTTYIIDGYDRDSYCAKHVSDTITVKLVDPFHIYMTSDTTIVWNQTLWFKPTTDFPERIFHYDWTPSSFIEHKDSSIYIAMIPKGIGQQFYTLRMEDQYGCSSASKMAVHIFQTATGFFVPSAFTPNNDGKNDILKPTLAGVKQLDYFKIYNRWGQLIYTTQIQGQGWDGYLNGQLQPSGSTYIYQVEGKDYNDKKIVQSGTIVLVR